MILLCVILFLSEIPIAQEIRRGGDTIQIIEYLLKFVEESECVFIRNGREHDSKKAARHMKRKYEHFKDEIKTPEDFIRLAGTRSTVSGKPYEVRLKNGKEELSSSWLQKALEDYRSSTLAVDGDSLIESIEDSLSAAQEGRHSCSTFAFEADSLLFVGHNLDETPGFDVPGLVCVNKRNVYREGITWFELIASPSEYEKVIVPFEDKPEPKISWVSKYGSVTFNSEGIDFPDGGVNEKGLSVFEMSLGKTRHKHDESNPTLFICLWIQYQLDNCSLVDEVVWNACDINLQGWSWHYFVSDRNGDFAIIEFIDGIPVIHRGEDVKYPVLCNSEYALELERLEKYSGFKGMIRKILPKTPRFVRAARGLDGFDKADGIAPKEYALELLKDIQVKGWNKWSMLADIKKGVIYFNTEKNRNQRYISFASLDFDTKPAQYLDIDIDLSGDVAPYLSVYSYQGNLDHATRRAELLFEKRFKGLEDNGVTSVIYARRFADYSKRIRDREMK